MPPKQHTQTEESQLRLISQVFLDALLSEVSGGSARRRPQKTRGAGQTYSTDLKKLNEEFGCRIQTIAVSYKIAQKPQLSKHFRSHSIHIHSLQ